MNRRKKIVLAGLVILIIAIVGLSNLNLANGDEEETQYYIGGMTENVVGSTHFLETGWRTVEEWEVERCSRKLSSELTSEISNQDAFTDQNFAYGTSATLQALYQEEFEEYFYELAWYIQPTDTNVTFTLSVIDEVGNLKQIIEPKTIKQNQGRGFYHSFVDTVKYKDAILNFQEGSIRTEIKLREQ